MKRILTVQDVSCVGKCSLTVALPIISAAGIETSVLPTAVLSTHTQFKGFTFCDLTNQIEPIAKHWKQEGLGFDAIYTGYLGSFEQLALIENLIADFKTDGNLIFVDPVMADAGKLYVGFDQAFADRMALFCSKADVIVPNLTEASFMLHTPYVESGYDENYIDGTLEKLIALGPKVAVLTGVSYAPDQLADKREIRLFPRPARRAVSRNGRRLFERGGRGARARQEPRRIVPNRRRLCLRGDSGDARHSDVATLRSRLRDRASWIH